MRQWMLIMAIGVGAAASLPALEVQLRSPAAILINGASGVVLYEKNADQRRSPASTTKIATALYVLATVADHLADTVEVDHDSVAWISAESKKIGGYRQPAHWLEPGGTHMALKKGEVLSLEALLYGMMVVSADDAANVIARYVGGSVPQFMERLNDFLRQLGCDDTHFANPHGLYHPKHYSTARDLARLTRCALQDERFRQIVKTVRYQRPKTNKQEATTLLQTNKLLRSGKFFLPGAIGVKTGYIAAAGYCLVAAAEKQGRCLIAVLLGGAAPEDRYHDALALFGAAFAEQPQRRQLVRRGPQPFLLEHSDADRSIETYCDDEFVDEQYPSEATPLHCELQWRTVTLPLAAGATVGDLLVRDDGGATVARLPVKAQYGAALRPWYRRWLPAWSWSPAQLIAGFCLALVLALGLALRRR